MQLPPGPKPGLSASGCKQVPLQHCESSPHWLPELQHVPSGGWHMLSQAE